MRRLAFFFLACLCGSAEAQRWIQVPGPNFTVYTNAGDNRGREIVQRFEQMRRIFPELIPRERVNNDALVVVAFKDHRDLLGVAPLYQGRPVDVGGLYLKGEDRNFIVLDAGADQSWQPVYHEYAHHLLDLNMPPTPLWWDEGFADYFSTVRIERDRFSLGAPPAEYVNTLRAGPMPLERVMAVTRFSPEYKSMEHGRGSYYATAWLLAHYLLTHRMVPQAMSYFDLTFNQRMAPAIATQRAFGKTLKELDAGLKAYLEQLPEPKAVPITTAIEKLSYPIQKVGDSATQALLGNVNLHSPDHQAQAEAIFRQTAQSAPLQPAAHAGLGYVFLRKGQVQAAKDEFVRATELGSADADVWYFAAFADFKEKGLQDRDSQELIELNARLDKALQLDPNYADALNLKALVIARAANPAEAIRLLRRACELRPRNEEFKLNLAHQYLIARRFDEADAVLERLRKSADPAIVAAAEQKSATAKRWRASKIEQLADESADKYTAPQWRPKPGMQTDPESEKLERRQNGEEESGSTDDKRPIKFAKGTLLSIECAEDGPVRLRARIGPRVMRLQAANRSKVLTIGADALDCSWKNRPVSLNYKERSGAEADLVSIEVK